MHLERSAEAEELRLIALSSPPIVTRRPLRQQLISPAKFTPSSRDICRRVQQQPVALGIVREDVTVAAPV